MDGWILAYLYCGPMTIFDSASVKTANPPSPHDSLLLNDITLSYKIIDRKESGCSGDKNHPPYEYGCTVYVIQTHNCVLNKADHTHLLQRSSRGLNILLISYCHIN